MKRVAVALSILVIAALLGIVGREVYRRYQDLKSQVSSAESHLRAAQAELRTIADSKELARVGEARREFAIARREFDYIGNQIESFGMLYDIAEALPSIGNQVRAARKLTRAGEYVSQAGEETCLAVESIVGAKKDSGESRYPEETEKQRDAGPNTELPSVVTDVSDGGYSTICLTSYWTLAMLKEKYSWPSPRDSDAAPV